MNDIGIAIILLIVGMYYISCMCIPRKSGFSSLMVKDLSNFGGRKPGTYEHHIAYLYLLERVKEIQNIQELSWAPGYTQEFTHGGKKHQNIVFGLRGSNHQNKKIIIMAHYDHLGYGFPGSNDNGSGVFGLLQTAEYLSSQTKPPIQDVIFVLTDGEETDLFGSQIIYEKYPFGNIIINIDTIGGFHEEYPVRLANNGNYSEYIKQKARDLNMPIQLIDIKPDRSDIHHFLHGNTCLEFGYPQGKYHTHDDTYENLELKNMLKIIELIKQLVYDLSHGILKN